MKIKIKIGKHIFQTYPISELDVPRHWVYFEKIRLFGKTIGAYWLLVEKNK
jgi:hypothetical protein